MKRIIAFVLALVMALSVALTASAVSYRLGSQGSGVARVQKYLTDNHYADLKADGKFGKLTVEAVKTYQKAHGLKQDGIVGPKTLAAMGLTDVNDNNPEARDDDDGYDNSVMKLGSTGPSVKEVQAALKELGYPVGKIDGKFGKGTQEAVVIFQRLNNLTADGKVGHKTSEVLFSGQAAPYKANVGEKKYTLLKIGSRDNATNKNAVSRLQRRLNDVGCTCDVTGYYSDDTANAVRAYQTMLHPTHLEVAIDGKAGPITQAYLYGDYVE